MKEQNAVIIANHGVVVVGKTYDYCIRIAVLIEKMAQIYLAALKVGKVKTIPVECQKLFTKVFKEKYSTI